MSEKKKSNRKFRSLKMESLEKRELMAADAFIENGVLNIRGTDAADNIRVESSYGTTRVWANGKRILQEATTSYSSVDAQMNGGNDGLSVNSSDIGTLSSNMGGGRDFFGVSSTSIGQAAVNLGSGDDEFRIDTKNSQIRSGFVDGGPGRDRFRNFGGNSPGRVVVRNFEW
jgi:hypothetical protein